MEGSAINRETAHKIAIEVKFPDINNEMTPFYHYMVDYSLLCNQ